MKTYLTGQLHHWLIILFFITCGTTLSAQLGPAISYQIDSSNCNAAYVTFTCNPNYQVIAWDFNNGHISADSVVQEVFYTNGNHTITLLYYDTSQVQTSETLVINISGIFRVLPVVLDEPCNGACDGLISLSVINRGTLPYTFEWGGITYNDSMRLRLCAGAYTYTVTDSAGCIASDTATIFEPLPLTDSISVWSLNCQTNNIVIEVFVFGGSPPYTYQWSNGSNIPVLFNVLPGWYSFSATDGNGCMVSDSVTVTQQSTFLATQISNTISSCSITACNDTAFAAVTGGTPPFTYAWSTGDTTNKATGLCFNTNYYLTVTDSAGCVKGDTIFIAQPSIVSNINSTLATCGLADGSAFVNYQTNYLPATVNWSNGTMGDTANNLLAGIYFATIDDALGCQKIDTVEVVDSCGSIQGLVFDDINGNGIQDTGEAGIAGITITAMPGNIAATTDSQGNYTIIISIFGTYTVSATLPLVQSNCGGFMVFSSISFPASPGTHTVAVTNGSPNSTGNYFGIAPPSSFCGKVSGEVFYDENGNGIKDGIDIGMANKKLLVNPGGNIVFTNASGIYSFYLPHGSFTVELDSITFYTLSTPNSFYTINFTGVNDSSINNNFGITPTINIDEVQVSLTGWVARPGFVTSQFITYENTGNTIQSGTINYCPDAVYIVNNAIPNWDTQTGGCYDFSFINLYPGEQRQIRVNLRVPANVNLIGTTLCSSATVTLTQGNNDSRYIVEQFCQIVTGSYDPNDKQATPEFLNPADTTHVLDYRIRFQNTGTDTAFTVVVRDTLDQWIDINSVQMVAASHEYQFSIENGNIAVWTFNNVLLPDSNVNEPESHGFIKYRLKLKSNFSANGIVYNQAGIYFDYNPPVMTNTTQSKIFVGIYEVELLSTTVYPNPTNNTATIEWSTHLPNFSFELYDVSGRKVLAENNQNGNSYLLKKGNMQAGFYFYQIKSKGKNMGLGKVVFY